MDTTAQQREDLLSTPSAAARLATHLAGLALAAFGLVLVAGLVAIDAMVLRNGVAEGSLTEIAQEWLLMLATLAVLRRARHDAFHRGFALLLAGLLGAMFFREMDGLLDRAIAHGSWRMFVWPWLVLTVGLALRFRATILRAGVEFIETRAYILMATGLLIVLVYSRVIGLKPVWNALQDVAPLRTVKNAVEESVESLGYSLIACGAWIYGGRRS